MPCGGPRVRARQLSLKSAYQRSKSHSPAWAVAGSPREGAQGAGLTLAEIRSVLALRDGGQAPCEHATALNDQHLEDIERRPAEEARRD
ncbi:MerR family DNA-binding protein [Streptomyces sp. NPDC058092]|uniref:MerR family DNA-binding protein n=1 Tax=Streptomyces sp. NPDC058092 TaxID=3346336 RepID=UPI0036E95B93